MTHDQAKTLRDQLFVIITDGKQKVKLSVFGSNAADLKNAVVSSFDPGRLAESFDLTGSEDGDCTYLRIPVRLGKEHRFTVQTESFRGEVPGAKPFPKEKHSDDRFRARYEDDPFKG